MTRLTNLILDTVRGEDPIPIPFPTQFCNMIYLQRFTSINNNFSGFFEKRDLIFKLYFISFIGPIPIELTRLAHLERLDLSEESLLTGFIERRIGFHFHLLVFIN